MSFFIGNDKGIRKFGKYRVRRDKSKIEGDKAYVSVKYESDGTREDLSYADTYVASKVIKNLEGMGINVSERKRKGILEKGTHITFENGYKVEVGSFASYVYVKAKGDRKEVWEFLSRLEEALSEIKPFSKGDLEDRSK